MLISLIAIKIKTDSGWFKLPSIKGSPGFSAYQIWLNAGNTGSVDDYLHSLKGSDGAPGIQGLQGPIGPQGISGNTYQFIYRNTPVDTPPTTPSTSQNDVAPAGWFTYPVGVSEGNKYQWISSRIRVNGIWGNYTTPTLWSIYSTGGDSSSYILPQATDSILGGVKATARTSETTPVVIDTTTGLLYTSASGSGGGIEDVALNVGNPKLYGRYSGDQSWQEILPPEGSVGNLQQVTTNGATSDKLITLSGGLKLSTLLQLPDTDPTELLDAGKYGLYVSDTGISGELPTSGGGGDYILPKASATVLGGIKVGSNLSIDPEGVLSAIGTGEGSVGTLQQVTENGASTNILVNLTGGIKIKTILQVPTEDPSLLLDENSYGLCINDSGISGETPAGYGNLPIASATVLGGVKANSKTTESTPVVIDSSGFLFTSGGSGGGIPDVPLDTVNPKIYGRYSGDQSWTEILPPQGNVGTLQEVTTNGASSDKLLTLSGGIKVEGVLQLPTENPSLLLDANSYGLCINDSGISGETPSGGTGTSDHSLLTNRDAVNSHPTSAITGLDTALQNFSENLSTVSNAVNNKLDNSHTSDTQAHKSIFDTKAALNGNSTKDFATKNLTVNGTATMVENINTNLRIPQVAPTNPVTGQIYLYIE